MGSLRLAGWHALPSHARRLLMIHLLFGLGYNGMGLMLTALLFGVPERSRAGHTIVVGLGALLTLLPMATIPHWLAAVSSRVALGVCNMMRMPLMQMFAMAQVPQERRSLMSGILNTSGGICLTLVGYLGGALAARHGYRAVFWAGSGVTAAAVLLFALVTRGLIARGDLRRA